MIWAVVFLLALVGILLWGRYGRRSRSPEWQMPEERRHSEERKQFKDKEDAKHKRETMTDA